MKSINYNLTTILFLVFIFSYSCKNNLTEVEYLLKDKKNPDISSEGVVYTYSEEGTIVLKIDIEQKGLITPISESFQSIIWHLIVSHPLLQIKKTKW